MVVNGRLFQTGRLTPHSSSLWLNVRRREYSQPFTVNLGGVLKPRCEHNLDLRRVEGVMRAQRDQAIGELE